MSEPQDQTNTTEGKPALTAVVMRDVTLLEYYKPDDYKGGSWSVREAGKGKFHTWGVDYEEFEAGPGNFSTAIVEMPDGTVRNWRADMIRFNEA